MLLNQSCLKLGRIYALHDFGKGSVCPVGFIEVTQILVSRIFADYLYRALCCEKQKNAIPVLHNLSLRKLRQYSRTHQHESSNREGSTGLSSYRRPHFLLSGVMGETDVVRAIHPR